MCFYYIDMISGVHSRAINSLTFITVSVKHLIQSIGVKGQLQQTLNFSLNMHTAYLNNFFLRVRELKHNKYIEIKLFPKVDIEQNNISSAILLIKLLVYQWDPRHLQASRVDYIFVYITKSVFSLISNHIFININHLGYFLF